ncbi:DUF255 domain-containing protein [Pontibacter sp. G13]|uniref:thioredoxin domain-containing protein n=1 Tax=Pontibacter sp. G13 TaxID=3074898 RepID=UPI00288B56D0|nr:DUF255 domain-containing protein [Pontibacter sp. G13]WNJ17275.1 DUF255 domain-containing protein [Pontibacter sp. G13]
MGRKIRNAIRLLAMSGWGLVVGCTASQLGHLDDLSEQPANHLIVSSSPYLLSHAHDPVDWLPYDPSMLERAQREDVPIFLHIGSFAPDAPSSEKFQDTVLANWMNSHYLSVMVDVDERPDIALMFQHAKTILAPNVIGWPASFILLPDGRPIYAGREGDPEPFRQLLQTFWDLYRDSPLGLNRMAEDARLSMMKLDSPEPGDSSWVIGEDEELFEYLHEQNLYNWTTIPQKAWSVHPVVIQYLLEYPYFKEQHFIRKRVLNQLEEVAFQGIYDHLGGGFFRYSHDLEGHFPHFEKTLLHNAQMLKVFAIANQIDPRPIFQQVIYQTTDYLTDQLQSSRGGYYTSQSAVSEDENGRYYVWPMIELELELGGMTELFSTYFNATEQGNWQDGQNVLYRRISDRSLAYAFGMLEADLQENVRQTSEQMLKVRDRRITPDVDLRSTTAGNALMIEAWLACYQSTGEARFLELAMVTAGFVIQHMWDEPGYLVHNWKDAPHPISSAYLDDYAHLARAFLSLYQVTLDAKWADLSHELVKEVLVEFYDSQSGRFYYTIDKSGGLLFRPQELADIDAASSNAVMAELLMDIGDLYQKPIFRQLGFQILSEMESEIRRNPAQYPAWWNVRQRTDSGRDWVIISGPGAAEVRQELASSFLPNVRFAAVTADSNIPLTLQVPMSEQLVFYHFDGVNLQLIGADLQDVLREFAFP